MGIRKQRRQGPQQHAEGAHGDATHRRFIEQLNEGTPRSASGAPKPKESSRRLHQNRQQHDEAEKDSEKTEALRLHAAGDHNENVVSHARVPHKSGTA